MIRGCAILILMIFGNVIAFAQEPLGSTFAEMEDSMSSLSITPLKPTLARKVLSKAIDKAEKDLQNKHKVDKYQINATFNRDSMTSFSVSCDILIERNYTINYSIENFKYDGPYTLTRQDSAYIVHYIKWFTLIEHNKLPLTSPVRVAPASIHGMMVKLGDILYPLKDYDTTLRYYYYSAYSIGDASGKGIYRLVFSRNKKKRLFENRIKLYNKKTRRFEYDYNKYEVGEIISGTAYFDIHSFRITQFKGHARMPYDEHIINVHFQNDYDNENDIPVLRQTKLVWEVKGTKIKATVQRIKE